jgi:hypothetical protein
MGRVLVVYPQRGFLNLVKQVLNGSREVDICQDIRTATERLISQGPYEAVLCGIDDSAAAIQFFGTVVKCSPATRLIPIAVSQRQIDAFLEQWRSDTNPRPSNSGIGMAWLPDPCTATQVLELFRTPVHQEFNKYQLDSSAGEQQGPRDWQGGGKQAREQTVADDRDESEREAWSSGDVLDGYRLVFVIGKGGFGTTWLAVNETTGNRVAIKCVQGDEQTTQELSGLSKYVYVADLSDSLIPVEHINRDERGLWLITPLADSVTGGDTADSYKALSLATYLDAMGHLSEAEACGIAASLARALKALHRATLLHGDVSPFNILSVRNRWVLADPGLVRFVGDHGHRDRRYYPKPEVVHARDDLYAVGLVLWDMTSGIWEMVLGKERLRVDERILNHIANKSVPISRVLCRALAENPEARYMSAEEMLHDLEWVGSKLSKVRAEHTVYAALRLLRTG